MAITATLSDSDILRRVEAELEWNPRVSADDITAKVKDRIVTLTGFVDTYAHKLAAIDAVHHVSGVLDVADEMEVRDPKAGQDDQELAKSVRMALVWDVFVPDERIQSTVSRGWVTLEGTVERWQQREDAARAVERLRGVRGVTNRIEIRPSTVDAAKIRSAIEGALTRRAERETKRLQISVDGGTVTLRGTVDSWAEKNALERLASYAPGVQHLVSRITVDSYQ